MAIVADHFLRKLQAAKAIQVNRNAEIDYATMVINLHNIQRKTSHANTRLGVLERRSCTREAALTALRTVTDISGKHHAAIFKSASTGS